MSRESNQSSNESKVGSQYDRLAEIYDRRWHSYVSNTLNFLIAYLHSTEVISSNKNVIDIACGTGELERLLINADPPLNQLNNQLNMVGVDISEKMLDMARLKLPNLEFIKASAISLPFPDHSFDVAITASAFHYFEHPVIALNEIRRILKPQGKLIIMDWCRDYWSCRALNLFLKIFDPAHKGCYTQKELNDFLSTSGFNVTAEQKQKLGIFWGVMIATGIYK